VSLSCSTSSVVSIPGLLVEPIPPQIYCKNKRCRAGVKVSHLYFLEIPPNRQAVAGTVIRPDLRQMRRKHRDFGHSVLHQHQVRICST
jgi:hypothetical protein